VDGGNCESIERKSQAFYLGVWRLGPQGVRSSEIIVALLLGAEKD